MKSGNTALLPTMAMIVSASLVGLITGYTVPLISLNLSQQNVSVFFIGLLGALPAAGMMLSSFLTPSICRYMEIKPLLALSLILLLLSTFLSCRISDPFWLAIPRVTTGCAAGIIVVLGESWVTGRSSTRNKAMLTGIYTACFTGFQLAGPLLISLGEDIQVPVLYFLSAITAGCLALLTTLPDGSREQLAAHERWRTLFPYLPVLGSGVLCFSFFDASILSLLPLYGIEKGLSAALAVLIVTVILAGDALFQTPVGWLADRLGIRRIHIGCGGIFCLMLMLLPFTLHSQPVLMAICVVLGAAGGALYTLSLVRAGNLFSGQKLIMMNAVLGLVWSAGSIAGPAVSGIVIRLAGYDALIVTLFFTGAAFIFIQCVFCKRR